MSNKVIIIGGGLSGTLLSIFLAEKKDGPEIILVEKNPQMLGRGVAYQHDFTHQPLNVVAGGMSLFPDRPGDFVEWLKQNQFRYNHLIDSVSPQSFVPRKIFGDYLLEHLDRAHHEAAGRFQIRIDEAISVLDFGKNKTVVLASGSALQADHVVLALGNFPPADLFGEKDPVNNDPRYYANPWSDRVYSQIEGHEDILLVGTGLTAVDIVLGLKIRNFGGTITMLSRRGRLPLPHDLSRQALALDDPGDISPAAMLRWVRKKIKDNPELPWPSVLDGLRPYTAKIWERWSAEEKRVFLRRIRPFWEVARHRIPTQSSAILQEMVDAGQLQLRKGKVLSGTPGADGIDVTFEGEKGVETRKFHKIINCTGPESNYRKVRFPIIRDLIERSKVVSDELGLGISCTADGHILNSRGEHEPGIWCIGPMRKAALWETTALREVREQAKALAATVGSLQ